MKLTSRRNILKTFGLTASAVAFTPLTSEAKTTEEVSFIQNSLTVNKQTSAQSTVVGQFLLSDHRNPEQNGDDSLAMMALWEAAKNTGGEIVLPPGEVIFKSYFQLVPSVYAVPLKIVGQSGTRVILDNPTGSICKLANFTQVVWEHIVFKGVLNRRDDCQNGFILFGGAVVFKHCEFYGVHAQNQLVLLNNADGYFENCFFSGCGGVAIARASYFVGATFRGCDWIDYGHLDGQYFSKSSDAVHAWVALSNPVTTRETQNARGQRAARFEDCRFDEAAITAIYAENLESVKISGAMINGYSAISGKPLHFRNVKHLIVEQSWAGGFSNNPLPYDTWALLENVDYARFDGCYGKHATNKIRAASPELVTITGGDTQVIPIVPFVTAYRMNAAAGPDGNFTSPESAYIRHDLADTGWGQTLPVPDLTGITEPAPASVYATNRAPYQGSKLEYIFPNVDSTKTYRIRIHFNTIGPQQSFSGSVLINGERVLNLFNPFSVAGAVNKAVIQEFVRKPQESRFVIEFLGDSWGFLFSGIEILLVV